MSNENHFENLSSSVVPQPLLWKVSWPVSVIVWQYGRSVISTGLSRLFGSSCRFEGIVLSGEKEEKPKARETEERVGGSWPAEDSGKIKPGEEGHLKGHMDILPPLTQARLRKYTFSRNVL